MHEDSVAQNALNIDVVIGIDPLVTRSVDPAMFDSTPRFHSGGVIGGEIPIIAKRGKTVLTPGQMRALSTGLLGARMGQKPEVKVTVNVDNRAPGTETEPPGMFHDLAAKHQRYASCA